MRIHPHALDALKQQALSQFRSTQLGRLVADVQRMRNGRIPSTHINRLSQQIGRLTTRRGLQSAVESTDIGRFVGQIDRYAKRGLKSAILDEVLGALGPLGSIISSILSPRGKPLTGTNGELQAAADLLRAFGYKVEKPATQVRAEQNVATEAARAQKFLENLGFKVLPPGAETEEEQPLHVTEVERVTRGGKIIARAGGIEFHVSADDPLLTGQMVGVTSSNVHSIGFQWNNAEPTKGTLKVRFLDKSRGEGKGGPTYGYYAVHPALFQDMRRAASKGKWVWDHLRIRGTVSGHRFRYSLDSLSPTGYVPRRATRIGGEEWYKRRTVTGRGGKVYRSELEDEFVQFWKGKRNGGGPNRGRPQGPNRGAPNRGR